MNPIRLETRTPNKPRYKPGHRQGHITVVRVIEHAYRHLAKKIWWYEVHCSCGATEDVNQGQMREKQRCKHCSPINQHTKPQPVSVDGIPDFARMKLR